jgi:hypothetical protein
MDDLETQAMFGIRKGQRESDRLVQDCLDGLTLLLHDKYVQINGKGYPVKVIAGEGRIMFDIRNLPSFDHVEFTLEKTGWGRGV